MKVTISDIAKAANVSRSTVSNALNNKPGVSSHNKAKIKRIAENLGYKSIDKNINLILKLLVVNKNANIIGDTPFFSELIKGIESECMKNNFSLMISHLNLDETINLNQTLENLTKNVSGVMVLATELNYDDIEKFNSIEVPYVFLDCNFNNQKYDFISINNFDSAYDITKYIISKGHKNIGIINSPHNIKNFSDRKEGFLKCLKDNNLQFKRENEILCEAMIKDSYNAMKEYLENNSSNNSSIPTAFFAVNDNVASGAMKAFSENKLKISIAGFDNLPISTLLTYPLTTVDVNKNLLGSISVKRLIDRINDKSDSRLRILMSSKIIERQSVFEI